MNIGMLWFDNDPKTSFAQKVNKATAYYLNKYGKSPNMVFVSIHQQNIENVAGVTIKQTRSVLPGHFWVGLDNDVQESSKGERDDRQ